MKINVIVAVSQNGVIGRNNTLPWRLKDDLKWFKEKTLGQTIIMGRNTFESIGSKPLPKRNNIVVSRTMAPFNKTYFVYDNFVNALSAANRYFPDQGIFVIGGSQLYNNVLGTNMAGQFEIDKVYRTLVLADIEGDAYFPPLSDQVWGIKVLRRIEADENNEYPFEVQELTIKEEWKNVDFTN